MALSYTPLIQNVSTTDGTSYTTAAYTPLGLTLWVVKHTAASGDLRTPTLTGNATAWTLVGSVTNSGNTGRISFFRGTSRTPGALLIDFGAGNNQTQAAWASTDIAGAAPTEAAAFGTVVTNTGSGVATAVLASPLTFTGGGNGAAFAVTFGANEAVSAKAGWTSFMDQHAASPNNGAGAEVIAGTSDPSPTMTWTTNAAYACLAVEIIAAVAGVRARNIITRRRRRFWGLAWPATA